MKQTPILSLRNISKKFGTFYANTDISIDFFPGEIHSVVGENGAGKTTLMNIISGIYSPTSGEILYNGKPVSFKSPQQALDHGIAMVHQHFMLANNLTVLENLMLVTPSSFFISRERGIEQIQNIMENYNMPVPLNSKVWQLSVGEKQRIEILKALVKKPKILILDEPTAVLSPSEIDNLFQLLRKLRADGYSIIFISHKIKEVLSISDRITVLRHGKKTADFVAPNFDEALITQAIVGSASVSLTKISKSDKQSESFSDSSYSANVRDTVFSVQNLWVKSERGYMALKDINFSIASGEILGFAGVEGNGQKELELALYGMHPIYRGQILLKGKDITHLTIAQKLKEGIAYIPGDRKEIGVALKNTVFQNILLKHHLKEPFLIPYKKRKIWAQNLIQKYDIRSRGLDDTVANLSGGNIQKLIIAREFELKPNLIIAANPTRGIDIQASVLVHNLLLQFAQRGCAILIISTDLDELMKLSQRILVLYNGEINGEFHRDQFDPYEIGQRMIKNVS